MTIDFEKYLQSLTDPSKMPGMNTNSNVTVSGARKRGVQAQQQQQQRKKEKEEKIKSRMEMKPTLVKRASLAEKLRGGKDTYKQIPQVIGMSGADPVGEFVVAGAALNPIFKLAGNGLLYTLARAKGNPYQNWARAKLLNRELRNPQIPESGNPISIKGISIKEDRPKLSEPSTSLKFYERKPSRISLAERMGIPKGERNQPFKPKQPTEHIQGEEAVKMFKEYGGESIPEGSINGEQLRKYVAEARERYGLVGNNNITDEEIAQALYKHSKELGGNTAAVNAQGEPQLLFRGDTRRYTQLKERMSPEKLATKKGTMDNSLGNLFLGEFPYKHRGVDRYIGTWRNFDGNVRLIGSSTGSEVSWGGEVAPEIEGYPLLGPHVGGGYKLYSYLFGKHNRPIEVWKLPSSMMESGVNDLNAFVVRTPAVRNATPEISVLHDGWLVQGAAGSKPHMSTKLIYDKDGFPLYQHPDGTTTPALAGIDNRPRMAEHYRFVLDDAKKKGEGLLRSDKGAPLRDEHDNYTYYALPNFNIRGAKHLLPYDLRIPRNWKDPNIYRSMAPYIIGGSTLYGISSQKQGGKLNFLKDIKDENNL